MAINGHRRYKSRQHAGKVAEGQVKEMIRLLHSYTEICLQEEKAVYIQVSAEVAIDIYTFGIHFVTSRAFRTAAAGER